MCPIKALFSIFLLVAIFSTFSEATKSKSKSGKGWFKKSSGGPMQTCNDQSKCLKVTYEELDSSICDGDCEWKVCLELDLSNSGCTKKGSVSHSCIKDDDTCLTNTSFVDFYHAQEVENLESGHKQCQNVGSNTKVDFLLKDGRACKYGSSLTNYDFGNDVFGSCQPTTNNDVSCTGNPVGKECVWSFVTPDCSSTPSPTPEPTPQPTPAPTPVPTCPPEPVCEEYVGITRETCGGLLPNNHGMWLWHYGGTLQFWKGPRPLVTPASFEVDGNNAKLTGIVTSAGLFYKYVFYLFGLSSNGTPYYQDLGVGCTQPTQEVFNSWKYYQHFNGTLYDLSNGNSYPLVDRGVKAQIGQAGSLLNTDHGLSFWFEIPNSTVIGDINLSIKCVTEKH